MKPKYHIRLALASVFALSLSAASATSYYWDTNGTTAGFGSVTGTWDGVTNAYWNTDNTGGAGGTLVAAPTSADDLNISAGTAGTVTITGTGTGSSLTFSDNVANTVTGGTLALGGTGTYSGLFVTNAVTAATTVSSALTLNNAAATIQNAGTGVLTVSGGITGAQNLTLQNNAATASGVTIATGSLNNTGTVTNSGTGAGSVLVSAVIGTNVTGVTENSATSALNLSGANTWTGGLTIKQGTVNVLGATAVTTSAITLGDTGGSTNAVLLDFAAGVGANVTLAKPISVVGNGQAQSITIRDSSFTDTISGAITLNNNATLTINQNTTAAESVTGGVTGTGNLVIGNTGGGGSLTISGTAVNNTGTVTNNGSGASPTTISAVIGGNVTGVTQSSVNSVLTLSGANTWAGGLTFSNGTLKLGSTTALGAAAGTFAWSNGTLDSTVANLTIANNNPISIANAGNVFTGTNSLNLGTGNVTFTGTTPTIQVAANTLTFGGAILATADGITKTGAGTLDLVGGTGNLYTGVTTVSAGTLQFAKEVALYNNNNASWTVANLPVASGATLAFNVGGGGEFTTGDVTTLLTNLDGAVSTNGLKAGSNIGFDTTNASGGTFTVSNTIANTTGAGGGAVGVTKLGANTLVLTGSNTYTGVTTVTAGILSTGTTGTLANGGSASSIGQATNAAANLILNGSTLQYANSGAAESTDHLFTITGGTTTTALDASGSNTITFSNTGAIAISGTNTAQLLTLTGTGGGALDPVLANNGTGLTSLTKTGTGTWTLGATETYTGYTSVDNGTLAYAVNNTGLKAFYFGEGTFATTTAGTLDANTTPSNVTVTGLTTQNYLTASTGYGTGTYNVINIGGGKTFTVNGAVMISPTTNTTSSGNGGLLYSNLKVTGAGSFVMNSSGSTLSINNQSVLDLSNVGSATITAGTIQLSSNPNDYGTGTLYLSTNGTSTLNVANINTAYTGNRTGGGTIMAEPGSGTLYIYGTGGAGTTANLNINTYSGTGDGGINSTFDVRGHNTVMNLGTLSINNIGEVRGTTPTGNFYFDTGTLTVANQVVLGQSNNVTTAEPVFTSTGTVNIGGGTTTFTGGLNIASENTTAEAIGVNGTLNISGGTVTSGAGITMATNVATTGATTQVNATINLTGGTLTMSGDIVSGAKTGVGTTTSTVTLNGGTLNLQGHNLGTAANPISTLNFQAGTLQNVATINGTGGLSKTGTGTLTLGGTDGYTGGTTVSGGTLQVAAGSTLGAAGGSLTMSGGTLDLGTTSQTVGAVSVTGASTIQNGSLTGTSYTGSLTSGTAVISANLLGAGSLSMTGAGGILALSGANTYNGGTAVTAGTLDYLNTGAQPAVGTTTVLGGATLGLGVGGAGYYSSANLDSAFANTLANVSLAATSNVGIDTTAGNFTYASNIAATTMGLAKLGANMLTLSGTEAYTGPTTVAGGTLGISGTLGATAIGVGTGTALQLQSSGAIAGASGLTLATGSTLQLRSDGATSFTVPATTLPGTAGSSVTLDVNQLTGAGANNQLALSGALTSTGTNGTATVNVTGGNGYSLGLSGITVKNNPGGAGAYNLDINPTTASVALGTVTPVTTAAGTGYDVHLTLDGTSTGNTVSTVNAASGGGWVYVYKQGTGTWTLGNFNAIQGDLFVNAGTLNITGTVRTNGTPHGVIVASGATLSEAGTGVISGATIVTSTGTTTLSGANTYTGATTINGGTLKAGSTTALGTGAVTVTSPGTLDLNGTNLTIGSLATGTGTITDNSAGTGISTLTVTGSLGAGAAELIKDGATEKVAVAGTNGNGTYMLLNSANTFSGGFTLTNNARLAADYTSTGLPGALTSGYLGTGAITIGTGPTDTGTIFVNSANQTISYALVSNTVKGTDVTGDVRIDSTNLTLAGTITANQADFAIGAYGGGSAAITGRITGANGLHVLDAYYNTGARYTNATVTLTLDNTGAANNYAGATTVDAYEVLTLGAAGQIPHGAGTGNVTVNGTFNLGGFSTTIDGLGGAGTLDGTSGTPTLTVGDNNATGSFSGIIRNTAGTLALVKTGSGTETLSGANTYGGATSVNNGTLSINTVDVSSNAQSLGKGGTLNLGVAGISSGILQYTGTGGALDKAINVLGNGLDSILNTGSGLLTLSGTITNNGTTVTLGGTGAITVGGTIAGTGGSASNLVVSDTGLVTLGTGDTYDGTTTVDAGSVLEITNANALGGTGAGTAVLSGGALELSGGITVGAEVLSLSGTGIGNSGALRNVSGVNTYQGTITLAADSRINTTADTLTLSGGIGGSFNLTIGGAGNTNVSGAITTNSLTMDGAGILTLSAANTYAGNTTVSAGTLALSGSGSIANSALITVAASATLDVSAVTGGNWTVGASQTLSGAGTVNGTTTVAGTVHPGGANTLSTGPLTISGGTYQCDINATTSDQLAVSGALTLSGATLNMNALATPAAASYTIATYTSLSGTFTGLAEGASVTIGSATYIIHYADGGNNITLTSTAPSGYSTWIAGYAGLSDSTPGGNPSGDGISNLMKYVLNGNPSISDTSVLPTHAEDGNGNLVFTYTRQHESTNDTTQIFEYSSDLVNWTDATVPTSSGNSGNAYVTITPNTPSAGMDQVVVTLPANGASVLFARLKVTQP